MLIERQIAARRERAHGSVVRILAKPDGNRVQSDDGSHMMLVRKRADFIRARQDRYLKIDQGLARPLIHRCRTREDESV
jgi:hypothetical protein